MFRKKTRIAALGAAIAALAVAFSPMGSAVAASSFMGSSFLGSSSNNTSRTAAQPWSYNSSYFAYNSDIAGGAVDNTFVAYGLRPGAPLFSGDRLYNGHGTINVGSAGFLLKDTATRDVYVVTSGLFANTVGVDIYTPGQNYDVRIGTVAYVANPMRADIQSQKPSYALIKLDKRMRYYTYNSMGNITNTTQLSWDDGRSSAFFRPSDFGGSTVEERGGLPVAGTTSNTSNWLDIGNPSDYRSDVAADNSVTLRRICMMGSGAGLMCAVSILPPDAYNWLGENAYIYERYTELNNKNLGNDFNIVYNDTGSSSLNKSLGGPVFAFAAEGYVPLGIIDTYSSSNYLLRGVSLNSIIQDAKSANYNLKLLNSQAEFLTAINEAP
ncbi:MAG: hypothetical protein Q3972_00025 [Corynebacterium sp.]|nr:hypothetical protein [Corynebacterium sp.]